MKRTTNEKVGVSVLVTILLFVVFLPLVTSQSNHHPQPIPSPREGYTLLLTMSGTGIGTLEANSTGPFYNGTTITIWANASLGSTFTGFTGSLIGTTTPQTLTFDGNETVDAAFSRNGPYTLTLTTSGTGTGTIEATPGPYYYGDIVTIWANTTTGSTFTGFSGDLTGTTTPQTLTINGNKTVDAAFSLNGPYALILTTSGTGTGSIHATPGPYYYSTIVTIWANASIGSTFTGFSGSLTGTTTPQTLFVDGNETVDAHFTLNGPYSLTLTTSGTGTGIISANPLGPYFYGSIVSISATANVGSTFTGFSGNLTGLTSPQNIIMNGDKAVNADFQLNGPYTLTLTTSGTGAGTIQASPAGPYYYGTSVTIWANASIGSTFAGFTGSLTGTTTPQTLTFDGNETVNAEFTRTSYILTLTTNGTGAGTIQVSPGPYYYGSTATIWANASIGSTFTGFTGSLTGTTTPQLLTFDGDETVNAQFTLNGPYTLLLTTSGTGTGTIAANTTGPYFYGSSVRIWANASTGSAFTGFSGSLTGTTTPQILIFDGDETVDASFSRNGPYTLLLTTSGTGTGTIEANPTGPYYYGDVVTIYANASIGSTFNGFTGDLLGTTTPQTLTMDANKAVNAQFTLNGPFTLTLTTSGAGAGTIQASPGPYYYGSIATIWANASIGSTFTGFTGSLTGTITPQTLVFDGDETVNANFIISIYSLALTTNGTGYGTIQVNTTGPYHYGSRVTIWANATLGSTFTGFTGSLMGNVTPQILIFDGNEAVNAEFTRTIYTLLLTTSGTGTGTLQTNSTGPYHLGTIITIWANASTGSTFRGFTGSLNGTTTPQTLIFDGNEAVNAMFTLNGPYTLLLTTSGTGTGTIEANTTGPFYYGYSARIWANASAGSSFIGFSGSLTGTTTPQVLVFDGNEAVNANFTINGPYTLRLTTSGNGSGTIEASPPGPYYYGQQITIYANASAGSAFIGFFGDLTGTTSPQTLIMDGDKTVDALFARVYWLHLHIQGSGTVAKNPDQPYYWFGQVVTLTALPDTWWIFDHWSGDLSGNTTPVSITVNENKSVVALFICYNHIPSAPERPTGETKGILGTTYNYTTVATDADGDQLYYQFNWGDGGLSDWYGPYDSGESITQSHNWTWKGIYSITVRAKDSYGAESNWSEPLRVKMPKETGFTLWMLIQQFFEKIFERFPHAFPVLRNLLNHP